jgi:hypothetical protein
MRVRLTLASLVAFLGLLALAEQASALSCLEPKPEEQFRTAEAAIVGRLLEIRPTSPPPEPGHNYYGPISAEFRWRVDEVHKGFEWFRPGDVITVDGMYYGPRLPPPEPPAEELGAVLRLFEGHWIWGGMMCDWISVADLRRVAAKAQAADPPDEVLTPLPTSPDPAPPPQSAEPARIAFHLAGQTGYELREALTKGIKLKIGCATPCTLAARLYLRPGLARKFKLRHSSKPAVVARGAARSTGIRPTGSATTTLHLRFGHRARERLKWAGKLKLSLKLTITWTSGARTTWDWDPPLTLERSSLSIDRLTRH